MIHNWKCMVSDLLTMLMVFAPLILYSVGVRP